MLNKLSKRLVSIIVASLVMISSVIIFTQATDGLPILVGNAVSGLDLGDSEYHEFYVTESKEYSTTVTNDLLNESLILKKTEISDNGLGYVEFCSEKSKDDTDAVKLKLCISPNKDGGYDLIIEDEKIGSIEKSEIYTFSFVKTDEAYSLVVNGNFYNNRAFEKFLKECGSQVNTTFSGEGFFKGFFKFSELDWEYSQKNAENAKIYLNVSESTCIKLTENTTVNTSKKHNWKNEAFEMEDTVFQDEEKGIYIIFKNDKTNNTIHSSENGDVLAFYLKKIIDGSVSISVYDGDLKNLGNIPESLLYKFQFCLKGQKYVLNVNDVTFENDLIASFMSNEESFLSISSDGIFETNAFFHESAWKQNSTDNKAVIEKSENGFTSITLNSKNQAVISPKKYNLLNNEIIIKNLSKIRSNNVIYIDLAKNSTDKGPSNAAKELITLAIEKYGNKYELSVRNANGEWNSLTGFGNKEECRIRIININGSFYFSVNDYICKNVNGTMHEFLQTFVDSDSACMSYIGFSCSDKGKLEVNVLRYKPDLVELTGFKVYSNSGNYDAQGNEDDGYAVDGSNGIYAISSPGYSVLQKSLTAKVKDVDGYLWFALSKSSYCGNELETGNADTISKVIFLITPKANKTQAQISYWNASGKAEETLIDTIDFDWQKKHSYDVRKGSDDLWYLAIDGILISRCDSEVLTKFMVNNSNKELHFGIGGYNNFVADEIKIIDQIAGDNTVIQSTKWEYFSPSGKGTLDGDELNGYTVSSDNNYLYAFSDGKWDVNKKNISVDLEEASKIRFYISVTDASDDTITPSGKAMDVNRIVLRMVPVLNKTGAQVYCENSDGKGGAGALDIIDFDWSGTHTFGISQGSDERWYFSIDDKLVVGRSVCNMITDFMNANSKRMRFGIGGFDGAFTARTLKIIDKNAADLTVNDDYWGYYNGVGIGISHGNNDDGYSILFPNNATFGTSNKKYDVEKTAVSFKVEDVNAWISFGISVTNFSDNVDLKSGVASELNRMHFLITPKLNATHAQFSYWNANGTGGESVIKTIEFDWYGTEHTYDIRKDADDGHWYLCVDGRVLMNSYSDVLDEFMIINQNKGFYYTVGGIDAFSVSKLKVIDKSKVKSDDNVDNDSDDVDYGFTDDDFGFDFDDSNEDNTIDTDFSYNSNDYQSDMERFYDEVENNGVEDDPHKGMIQVRMKKRKLIEKGHGLILNIFEKIAIVIGAIVFTGGITFSVIVLIKKIKKRKKAV